MARENLPPKGLCESFLQLYLLLRLILGGVLYDFWNQLKFEQFFCLNEKKITKNDRKWPSVGK